MFLTRNQVREVDRLAIERIGIPGIVLMENAGRNAAEHIATFIHRRRAERTFIFCGSGNNGGDGFVIARHLVNRGFSVACFLAGDPDKLTPDCETNYRIIRAMNVEVTLLRDAAAMERAVSGITAQCLIVDALLGTGFQGAVRPPLDFLIERLNLATKAGVVAVDVPSGLDCDTGTTANAAIRADLTITFVAKKTGFQNPSAAAFLGECIVADIGAPPSLLDHVLRHAATNLKSQI